MVIKYCSKCFGNPYTTNTQLTHCPRCNTELHTSLAEAKDLNNRPVLPEFGTSNNTAPIGGFDDMMHQSQGGAAGGFGMMETSFGESNNSSFTPEASWIPEPVEMPDFQKDLPVPSDENAMSDQPHTAQPEELMPYGEEVLVPAGEEVCADAHNVGTVVRGKIANYSNSIQEGERYRRTFFERMRDLVLYRQRTDDVIHRFTVRTVTDADAFGMQDYADIPVNVHGIISRGMQLTNNAEVEVSGRYDDGTIMAEEIHLIHNGYKSRVRFQHSVRAITNTIFALLTFVLFLYIGIYYSGGFFENIKTFFVAWLISAGIMSVLYIVFLFSRAGMLARAGRDNAGFPFGIISFLSVASALIFTFNQNTSFSVGDALLKFGLLLLTVVLIIGVIWFLIRSVMKK